MPAVPSSLIEPIWDQFSALLPVREVPHPLGCHRRRIPDRVVFDKLVQVLVFGCAYARIADATCSATTLRRRRDEWMAAGVMETLQTLALAAYDRMIGLRLEDVVRRLLPHQSPVRWRDGGAQPRGPGQTGAQALGRRRCGRHPAGDGGGAGQPPRFPAPGANARCAGLRRPADDGPSGSGLRLRSDAAAAGASRPDRSHCAKGPARTAHRLSALGRRADQRLDNAHKKLVWCTERRAAVIAFWIAFSAVIIIVGRLVRQAWTRYRWETRPIRKP